MNICKTEQEFIRTVAPAAQKVCKAYGFYLPSVLIAQAAKENGYGIPSYWDNPGVEALVKFNNMVGIKRDLLNPSWVDVGLSVWPGEFINKKTPEVYGGVPVTEYADFRIYDNIEQSFADYLCFMRWGGYSVGNPKYYNDIKDVKDYRTLIKIVHQKGYATGPTYSDGVIKIIEKHNLTQYDNLAGVEPSIYMPAIRINLNPNFEPTHNTGKRTGSIDYLYMHYVGSDGDAEANIEYYNQRTTTKASADFYCGFGGDIWQYNMDIEHRYCYAVGGGSSGAYFGKAKNANGISIEMCVRNSTKQKDRNHPDWQPNSKTWYFEKATVEAAVRLARHLMKTYGIPAERVIRHYDVNGKLCPGVVGWNPKSGSEDAWKEFKARLTGTEPSPQPQPSPQPEPNPTGATAYRIQVGAYKSKNGADNKAKAVKRKTGLDCFVEKGVDGYWRVFCGSFNVMANATKRKMALFNAGYKDSFIVEVSV